MTHLRLVREDAPTSAAPKRKRRVRLTRLGRLSPWRRLRKLSYKRNVALQAHEEAFLLMLIEERGCARQVERRPWKTIDWWCLTEPGRWDAGYLKLAFGRLRKDARLHALADAEACRRAA